MHGFLQFKYSGRQRVFTPSSAEIDGVRLRAGDRVTLRHQLREDENGQYVVVVGPGRAGLQLVDGRPLAPQQGEALKVSVAASSAGVRAGSFTLLGVPLAQGAGWRVGDRVILPSFGNDVGVVTSVRQHTAAHVRADIDVGSTDTETGTETEGGDPLGTCVTNPTIKGREQCESPYDAFGAPKAAGPDVWDAPCRKNVECPFFQKNERYPNYRGGCIAGYCEMPLGLQRVGFRKYYQGETSYPLCHGCPAERQRACCASQGADPDYAFELDQYERSALKPKT